MQYNAHNEKYKRSDIGGIKGEQQRFLKHYKNEVDESKSHLNVYQHFNGDGDWHKRIKSFVNMHNKSHDKRLRKDAVVFCSLVESVPASWPEDKIKEYFKSADEAFSKVLGKYGLDSGELYLSSIIHFDETTPHRTLTWIPFKDDAFNAKEIIKRAFLKDVQEIGWNNYLEFAKLNPDLEKLEPREVGSKAKHKTEAKYKADKEAELTDLEKKIEAAKAEQHELKKHIDELKEEDKKATDEALAMIEDIHNLTEKKETLQNEVKAIEDVLDEYKESSDMDLVIEIAELRKKNALLERFESDLKEFKIKMSRYIETVLEALKKANLDALADKLHNEYQKLFMTLPASKPDKNKNNPIR